MADPVVSFRCDKDLWDMFTAKANKEGKGKGQKLSELITEYLGDTYIEPAMFAKTKGEMWKHRAIRFLEFGEEYSREWIKLCGNTVYIPSKKVANGYIADLADAHVLMAKRDSMRFIYAGPHQLPLSPKEEALLTLTINQYEEYRRRGEIHAKRNGEVLY